MNQHPYQASKFITGFLLLFRSFLLLVIFLAGSSGQASAYSLRELLERYHVASGGLAQIATVRSMRMQGESVPVELKRGQGELVTIVKKDPDRIRITRVVGEQVTHLGANGKEAWYKVENGSGVLLQDQAAASLMRDASIQNELFRSADRGVTLQLLGREPLEVDGSTTQAYVIEATFQDGFKRLHFLHPQTFFLRRSIHLPPGVGRTEASESYYNDIRKVSDVLVAFEIQQFKAGELQSILYLDEVVFNAGVLDSFFDPPASLKP